MQTMLVERLRQAINRHDLDAFAACFDPDYRSQQPAHPAREFRGRDQVRKNWSTLLQEIPDLEAGMGEWHWHGTRANGERFEMRGVTVMGTCNGRIVWGRLYMEEVEAAGEDIDQAVQRLAGKNSEEPN
jgi:ketosteroid isomerase-like protein